MEEKSPIPTYHTIASALAGETGAGWKLAGWTAARVVLIAPPMMLVGVDWKRAVGGAALASGLISLFAYLRLYDATHDLGGRRFPTRKTRPRLSARRARR